MVSGYVKRDRRLIIAAISIPMSWVAGYMHIYLLLNRVFDWPGNGDPCARARSDGGHLGICEPQIPAAESYLLIAWVLFSLLAFGLISWCVVKPRS